MRSLAGLAAALFTFGVSGSAPATPYTDPSLLEVPWGHYSFIRQGWRGYLETVPAARYRDGLGIVWGQIPPHKSPDEVAAALAWAGFRRVRLEIPWGAVKWDESGLEAASAARTQTVLKALKAHGLRPLILLNANHLEPCPVKWREIRVQRAGTAGDRILRISGALSEAYGHEATVMSLADGTRAGPLLSGEWHAARGAYTVGLSKPLARDVASGETLRVAILRYAPLHPVGTSQFEHTLAGWLRYVSLVTALVEATLGGDGFDVEIWNELTFGSAFLDIDNYRDGGEARARADFLRPGGSAWELARETVALVKRRYPQTQVIWGFSNTTFFHVPIGELPPRLDGQSYHPYGTGRRCYADLIQGRRELLLDSFVPPGCVVQPEGYAHAWQQTESLLRLLAPGARAARPPASATFAHFITEHGFSPAQIGITDREEAERAKQNFLLRAPLLWLNKGLTALYIYDVYEPDDGRWGVLTSDGRLSSGLRALHRLTSAFAAAEIAGVRRQLSLEVVRDGAPVGVLPGDPHGEHLPQQEAAAFLPFQLSDSSFLIGAYVMTQDFPNALAPQRYRLTIDGFDGRRAAISYVAPDSGASHPATVIAASDRSLTLELAITDVPRLLRIDESPDPMRRGAT